MRILTKDTDKLDYFTSKSTENGDFAECKSVSRECHNLSKLVENNRSTSGTDLPYCATKVLDVIGHFNISTLTTFVELCYS